MKHWLSLVWLCLIALGVSSCLKDDDYSVSTTDRLSFSVEKVDLDTIIAGQATNTYSFLVYNRNKKALRLSQVYLEKGSNSPFFVNVDGSSLQGRSLTNIEIGAEDSIRVFLFANAADANVDAPQAVQDKLVFITEGGAQQSLPLEADAQSVYQWRGKVLTSSETLSTTRPYQIYDSLVVAQGATLTLNAGTRLYFHASARLVVRGQLLVNGTAAQNVVLRGDRLGNMFAGQPYDRIAGQWGGVVITGESYGNQLNFCDIHSGEWGLRVEAGANLTTEKLRLENSVIHNVSGDCLKATMSKIFVGNSQLTNAGGHCVSLLGGDNEFVQSTIANFYPLSANRGTALAYSNEEGTTAYPLVAATFRNTIVTGYSSDEITASSSQDATVAFNFLFQNCLLNTAKVEDAARIINTLWEDAASPVARERNFSPAFDLAKLLFTFGLDAHSPAVDAGDATVAAQYPNDRNGQPRLQDGKPDLGCYELTR